MPLPFLIPFLGSTIGAMLTGAAVGAAVGVALGYILDNAFKNVIIPWLKGGPNTLSQEQINKANDKVIRAIENKTAESIDIGLNNNQSAAVYSNNKSVVVMEYDQNGRFVKGTKIHDEELRNEIGHKIIIGV